MRFPSVSSRILSSSRRTIHTPSVPNITGTLLSSSLPFSSILFTSSSAVVSTSVYFSSHTRSLSSTTTTVPRSSETIPPIADTSSSFTPSNANPPNITEDLFDDPRTSILEAALHHVQREGYVLFISWGVVPSLICIISLFFCNLPFFVYLSIVSIFLWDDLSFIDGQRKLWPLELKIWGKE